ncbi:hypothetical protein [uncultured Psychroserpens sp.]|uniref:Spy/CpxP family protein refolding chaperone n=1 Tax=uncultured Psychroserpens sp. TaxID=255436 RepID=UPI002617BCC9|nr:hypothetical protein [uncultured Psychroserpens sp.]
MKTNKILYVLIIFLAVTNIFFLINHLGHSKGKKRGSSGGFIAKELKFDSSQMQQFKALNDQHEVEMKVISDTIKELKGHLFTEISEENISTVTVDSLTQLIGTQEAKRDAKTYYHFRAIQELCTNEQKEQFKKIVFKAIKKKRRQKRK